MLIHFTDNTKTQNVNVCKEDNMCLAATCLSHGKAPRRESVPCEAATVTVVVLGRQWCVIM